MLKKLILVLALAFPGLAMAQVTIQVPEVRVRVAPPAPLYEVKIAAPSSDATWIAGYWAWRGDSYVWIRGHWQQPPSQKMVWEPAQWKERDGNWYYVEGYWRMASPPSATDVYEPTAVETKTQVIVQTAPPRDIEEARPPVPFPTATWVSGYWLWNGDSYSWVAGHWSARRAGWNWVPDHWQRNADGRYTFAAGYWQRETIR